MTKAIISLLIATIIVLSIVLVVKPPPPLPQIVSAVVCSMEGDGVIAETAMLKTGESEAFIFAYPYKCLGVRITVFEDVKIDESLSLEENVNRYPEEYRLFVK